jgi:DNA-directed RNA polymerase specialized sigma24 family protein
MAMPGDEAKESSGAVTRLLLGLSNDALNALAAFDERKAQVVELRFFGGLSVEETAAVLKISSITVMRDWNTAKAWLYRELTTSILHES